MTTNHSELLPLVDDSGRVIGSASRAECHSGSMMMHPVVHLHVISPDGHILLQKRSEDKDIQPGRWDTSVGGHVDFGETVSQALRREAQEELGLEIFEAIDLLPYVFRSEVECELINPFATIVPTDYPFVFDPAEISEIRFFTSSEIGEMAGKGILTPNFEQEFERFRTILMKL